MTSHYDQGRLDNKSDFIMLPLSYSSSLHFSLSLSLFLSGYYHLDGYFVQCDVDVY